MARKIIHQLVDDLDGTELAPGDGETVLFALDGKSYEIDLTNDHAEELRGVLEKYVSAGRRGGSAGVGRPTKRRGTTGSNDSAAVRDWARANGFTVSERGRVSAAIQEAYNAAQT